METKNGIIKVTSQDIYNVELFNNNATILDEHVSKVASETELGHIKIGAGLQMIDGVASIEIDKIYPIGSIYMSINNISPASFIGGTWTEIKDRFLIGAGASYTVNSVGGESSHLLTTDELPENIGTFLALSWNTEGASGAFNRINPSNNVKAAGRGSDYGTATYSLSGGNVSHNNMPPYLAVYMWTRIA